MAVTVIFKNGLYSAERSRYKRETAKERVLGHIQRKGLRGVGVASIRNTGWHGESGDASFGGHLTVDFLKKNGVHITTHHVYRTDAAYGGF